MKNLPLAVQIWLLCAAVTLSISVLIMVFIPGMLQQFFTRQVLSILEDSQKNMQLARVELIPAVVQDSLVVTECKPVTELPRSIPATSTTVAYSMASPARPNTIEPMSIAITASSAAAPFEPDPVTQFSHPSIDIAALPTAASVPFMNHIYFSNKEPLPDHFLPEPFLGEIRRDASKQTEEVRQYTQVNHERTLLYVIRKTKVDGGKGYLLSYSWGTYRNDMAGSLYRQLMLLMLVAMVLSWIPSLIVSRHLSRPLVKMEQHVLSVGTQEWYEPLDLDRRDEIGKLARAFESMRERLVRQDQAQQTYLQNISHSLKTPIMVIQSYSRAIMDGIYPKGDLNASVLTIKDEADRTNKLVQDLLMLNKIKYFSTRDLKVESVQMEELLDEIAGKLQSRRPELDWEIRLADHSLQGDQDQWEIVVENLLDNATRYAVNRIQISLQADDEKGWWLRIWNDGLPIDADYQEKIFEEYYSGKGGQSGLGLAIVRHVVELHGAKVWAQNENDGVAFYIA